MILYEVYKNSIRCGQHNISENSENYCEYLWDNGCFTLKGLVSFLTNKRVDKCVKIPFL